MRPLTIPKIIFAAALSAGCAGTLGYSTSVSGGVYGPDLVEAAPGVMVIADYDEPIFYADNFYWRFDGGTWYRSTSYTGGWAYARPPEVIVRIDRPQRYTHYRPQGWTPGRGQRVRDHREPEPKAMRQPPPPQQQRYNPPPQQQRYNPPPQQRYNPPPQQQPYNPPPQQRYNPPPQQRGPEPREQPPTRAPDHRGDHGDGHDRGDGHDHRDHGK